MVTVLLAAYNGERYIAEQIDSVLNQDFKDFKIIIRDDGSTDSTADIIERYSKQYPDVISVIYGKPTKSASGNFFELLKFSDDDYIMLCDQDDFWLKNKIGRTLEIMKSAESENPEKPVLVHTDLKVADANLNIISDSFFKFQAISPQRKSLNNLLVQNNVTGCTVMINRRLLQLLKTVPEHCNMHDWWMALVACLFGVTDYTNESLILYRQHGDNQVGAKKASGVSFIINKIKSRKEVKQNYKNSYLQARQLLKIFGEDIGEEDKRIIEAFISLESSPKFKKIKTIKKYDFRKNTFIRTMGQYFSI